MIQSFEKAKETSQTIVVRAMGVSPSTIWRWKKKFIWKHTNAIKPLLNDKKTWQVSVLFFKLYFR